MATPDVDLWDVDEVIASLAACRRMVERNRGRLDRERAERHAAWEAARREQGATPSSPPLPESAP